MSQTEKAHQEKLEAKKKENLRNMYPNNAHDCALKMQEQGRAWDNQQRSLETTDKHFVHVITSFNLFSWYLNNLD